VCYAGAVPRFEPFAGLRYDAARVDLSAVVAPPYDVISPEERTRLMAQHSANAVRVELPEPDYRAGLDRYAGAASQLHRWQEEGIMVRDQVPALYAYRMTTGAGHATNGVIGALGIDDESAASILLHEETLPKAKSDRLELLAATRANLSPVWGLSLTSGLTKAIEPAGPPQAEAVDSGGVRHELWVIEDRDVIAAVSESVGASAVVLADGHHRYETARTYRRQRLAQRGPGGSDPGADLVMALIVEMTEDQIDVGPIERALSGLPDGLDLVDACSSWFDLTRVGDFDMRTTGALGASGALALVMASGSWILSPKDGTPEAAGSPLDSSMVALVIAELPDHEVEYVNSWAEGVLAIETGRAQAVMLLRPVTVSQIAEWAVAGHRMPPKTTYFHPKPATGMVFRTLDGPQ
jgi:uncharacterized protein (DUF1015 family)